MTQQEIEIRQREFMELLDPLYDGFVRFARAMTHCEDEARDLASDAVLKAYEQFGNLRKRESFKSFLFTIAHNLQKRKRWRRRFFKDYDEASAEEIQDAGNSPEIDYDVQALYAALEKLPAKQREAVVLFEISGFSLEEIKQIQGGTLSGVKSRVARGRQQLAELLKDRESSNISTKTSAQILTFKTATEHDYSPTLKISQRGGTYNGNSQ
ncbi:MAG TPA: RNA polymerase sigma factor [Patescibacteria group bacterium]|nr:RNA polymerase sigma factor [Patescibacteria group bacterium]